MKKVLLINTNTEKHPYPVPPLGLCLLATSLEGRYDVKVFDGVFNEGKGIKEAVTAFDPDYIGFSIRNIDDVVNDREIYYVAEIMDKFINPVKSVSKSPVILGGSGFSIFPEELMELTGADYGIAGEGEWAFGELLDWLSSGALPPVVPGLFIRNEPVLKNGFSRARMKDVRCPESRIDRHIDFSGYAAKGVYSIQTKRGCAHRCVYCTYPLIEGRKFRPRSPAEVATEIEAASERLGRVTFEFVDSTFNDPPGHAESICREIIRRKLRVRLRTMGINPRHSSEELFGLMREAGFTQIDATPDSASPDMLKRLGKGFTLQEVEKMAMLIRQFDLPTMWFFLFGGPGEDERTFSQTLQFIDRYVNPDDLVYMNAGMRVYPGTPLHRVAVAEGVCLPGVSLLHPPVYYYSGELGKERLDRLIRAAAMTRPNCLHAMETTPTGEMIAEAVTLRQSQNLSEPMFRTLLRIRKAWREGGRL